MTQEMYDCIEAERARKRWTIAQAAEKLGISEKTYRLRMYKCADLKCSELLKYAEVFGCSADYLLGLSDKIKSA